MYSREAFFIFSIMKISLLLPWLFLTLSLHSQPLVKVEKIEKMTDKLLVHLSIVGDSHSGAPLFSGSQLLDSGYFGELARWPVSKLNLSVDKLEKVGEEIGFRIKLNLNRQTRYFYIFSSSVNAIQYFEKLQKMDVSPVPVEVAKPVANAEQEEAKSVEGKFDNSGDTETIPLKKLD